MLHTSTPLPDSFKDNGSGSLDRVEVRSLLKQLNKAVGELRLGCAKVW